MKKSMDGVLWPQNDTSIEHDVKYHIEFENGTFSEVLERLIEDFRVCITSWKIQENQ